MIPVDPHWLCLLKNYDALANIDVIAIHAFPEMWWDQFPNWDWHEHWHGWDAKIELIKQVVDAPVWVTERIGFMGSGKQQRRSHAITN